MKRIWLFQAKPEWYTLVKMVPAHQRGPVTWRPTRQCNQMKAGDQVILWQSGTEAGVYALGKLKSDARKTNDGWRVDIQYEPLLRQPVFKKELLKHPILRGLQVLRIPRGASFPVTTNQWVALRKLLEKDALNIFRHYSQQENQFTNGLVCLLEASTHERRPLVVSFLRELVGLELSGPFRSFRVLRDYEGTADAELCAADSCIRIETKIESDSLRPEQVRAHLEWLKRSPETRKALVLLTPDDGNSNYIKEFLAAKWIGRFCSERRHRVVHLEWSDVQEFLQNAIKGRPKTVFYHLVDQFLRQIHTQISERDYAGVIQKIAFGDDSEVYAETDSKHTGYLDWIRNEEWGDTWHTPQMYKKLNGTGRKLLLYDNRRKAITVEAEIAEVIPSSRRSKYSCANVFVPKTLKIFSKPIPLDRIKSIAGFDNFTRGQAPAWNVTRAQYQQLLGNSK